ncbi:hypothetical protein GUITHDRAFT_103456 [Guillardia theta CCMP2712]|uniref:Uncharacterized protein n=2 Tax=Guillardia theta TaxID=55529 RepID=L1JR08_GUITC|nr:hypothetical protein GUITHDRAFT_103456 [Guillardia theta CCMP2712]EKX50867.1 hypothetical protein GUITHDRAFT_103456 [Guillardia theta CCMP2712]|eukprot:XP_005837847.1 hypothetical protein GUITHDRAFT_103456 [Guillardia theta CCMP2712]
MQPGQEAPRLPQGDDVKWISLGYYGSSDLVGKGLDLKKLQSQGKSILLHFWDYTSVDSLELVPVMERINWRFAPYGLVVIGVHRSRYRFAKNSLFVKNAFERLRLNYAVVNDIDGDITNAFGAHDINTMFLINNDNSIVAVKSGYHVGSQMEMNICQYFSRTNQGIMCNPQWPWGNYYAQWKQSTVNGKQNLWLAAGGGYDGKRCHQASKDVFVGNYVSDNLGHTSIYPGSLSRYQHVNAESRGGAFKDLSGVPLDDGAFALSGEWAMLDQGREVMGSKGGGLVDTHLRVRYHGDMAYGLLGLKKIEQWKVDMCTDGTSGNEKAGLQCKTQCRDVAGRYGPYGYCHTSKDSWGGCKPCEPVRPSKVYLLLDGSPVPKESRGADVVEDALGRTYVPVLDSRIYSLISE